MEPDATPPQPPGLPRLKAVHGVFFALVCAATAETILGPFMSDNGSQFASIGRMAIVFLSLYTLHRFSLTGLRSYRPGFKDLCTLTLILIGAIITVWAGRILAFSIIQYLATSSYELKLHPQLFDFAIPFAAGALLLQAVLGLHYALMYSLSLTITVGLYSPNNPILVPYILATSIMACLNLSRFRSRSAYIKAGINIAFISLPFALAYIIMSAPDNFYNIIIPIVGAFAGGILCIFMASGVTPIVEALGGYVTDMRLLEMATLDHPLLKDMSVQAPGTWNHSMVIGMMVDRAADAIGANAVLARVGAYFHDIGKMKKPLYFVENQAGGENRHDKLSSSMSALIIRSHVKDGLELGKKHKLPPAILDMIPQHHGTSTIDYFYKKAKKEAAELEGEDAEVDVSLYSYPGPRPQTREAGILMLADGIEAAARTISEPTPDRIQGMVQKMINKVFASGELNECELTLKDLHLIAKSFTQVLTSIHHQRIAYAEPAEKGGEKQEGRSESQAIKKDSTRSASIKAPEKNKSSQAVSAPESKKETKDQKDEEVADSDASKASDDKNQSDEDSKPAGEDLKRLGI